MSKKLSPSQIHFYLIGFLILLAGLTCSLWIYHSARNESSDTIGYEIVEGTVYTIQASESKQYRHDLERFGGKAAVFADDINRWFSGLWQGQRLAGTLAVLTLMISGVFFWKARHRQDAQAAEPDKSQESTTD